MITYFGHNIQIMLTAYSFPFITVYDTLLDMVLIFHSTVTPLELS